MENKHLKELYEQALKDYDDLQQELQESNESITWWTNRFNALSKENKKLNKQLEMVMKKEYPFIVENGIICRKNKEIQDYKSRIDKAIEYIKENEKEYGSLEDNERIILNILNGSD